jgi:hypothetical protein
MVRKPIEKGGLGVLNMKTHNQALFWNWTSFIKKDIQWVHFIWSTYYRNIVPHAANRCDSFWWKSIMKLSLVFRGTAACKIGQGVTTDSAKMIGTIKFRKQHIPAFSFSPRWRYLR